MKPSVRILSLVLALALTAGTLILTFSGMNGLERWFQSLTPAQQYWLPKVMAAAAGLFVALAAFDRYRRRARRHDAS